MKYFTPDLLGRFGSEDEPIASTAQDEWEEACARYNAYLASVKSQMPPGLRHIEDSYYLHDARIRGMGKQGQAFVIMCQLDTPPHPLLTFSFDLLAEPVIDTSTLPSDLRSKGDVVEWQYDELEFLPGEPAPWRWSILFSNGWQVVLAFRDVKVQEVQALIPAPRNGAVAGAAPSMAQST
jgi:hypothetical protein